MVGIETTADRIAANTCCLNDKTGRLIPRDERAEHAPEFFAQETWGTDEMQERATRNTTMVLAIVAGATDTIRVEDFLAVISKLKRGKTRGLLEKPMDFLKELEQDTMSIILGILIDWWSNENLPRETLGA